jgi:HSP20 family protein
VAGSRRHIGDLQGEIQELFAELWQVPRFSGMRSGFLPQCDCYRTDDPPALHVVVELPGVDPTTVQVVASGRALAVAGKRDRPRVSGARYQQMEIEYGAFQRQVQLAEDVEPNGATARFEHGILTVQLPVADRAPLGHVTIEVERV